MTLKTSSPRVAVDPDSFIPRHIGPDDADVSAMLGALGFDALDDCISATIPDAIRFKRALSIGAPVPEFEALKRLRVMMERNQVFRSFIGMGYYPTATPPVIQRNILENPAWYTAYTPYQAEIAQGRLEALLNFQTVVIDLTALPVANASLLDEATAAAEAMALCHAVSGAGDRTVFLVSEDCHPQTIDVVRTRANLRGLEVRVADHRAFEFDSTVFGALVQYPASDGAIYDYRDLASRAHAAGALVVAATDLLALTLLTPPGEWGADIAVGSAQRFGVPMGYGGPHAAFLTCKDDFKRHMPGRIIGVSRDSSGSPALRMALQTREQHIRREKATSNVCTAQVLLAVMASMYAVWHGPEGVTRIARRVRERTARLATALTKLGYELTHDVFFDTLRVELGERAMDSVLRAARERRLNVRVIDQQTIGVSLAETTSDDDLTDLVAAFNGGENAPFDVADVSGARALPEPFARKTPFLLHPVFNRYHAEQEMVRYIKRLESRDLSLVHSMIPLGSCTMKLNATAEMLPVTWREVGKLHPFAPREQADGYARLFTDLEQWLGEITGFPAVSLQPNAGSQGEFAGLLVIRDYHAARGESHRDVCLIPQSAHGTNPASAVMAGMRVVVVKTDADGNIDVADMRAKATEHAANLGALMVTYPSTHGVFEESIIDVCRIVHEHGGQVYMDGANMNAQVGLCRPGDIGADVCHLNLHKTFCIPHGGGGPGMGPIGVAKHLAPHLPGHAVVKIGGADASGAVSAAPFGSASILTISWMYCALMGSQGLTRATQIAILNANYIAKRLDGHYPVLYKGRRGMVAHECIVDLRQLKASAGVEVEDVAKRLMDYGFHAPTVSFPVAGTLMIEPTESESKSELDRFCDAMISIRDEIRRIEQGEWDRQQNPLKLAPHTQAVVTADEWTRPYSRQTAAFPAPWLRDFKFWPAVGRIDSAFGDRNLVCACPPVEAYNE
ncbi:MAG TPA: aminomethyl-transferring glycine dehydrogenase [Gemmatimonadaceae bacterium]|nr:aminomethyl-transferring glycine dehydrogenase [Gemmatimonadaceae bacterium]